MESVGCYFWGDLGALWLAISSCDDVGFVTTQVTLIAEAPPQVIEELGEAW
jgi:hypothetical protein